MSIQQHERQLDVCERQIVTLYETYNAAILGMIEELDSEFGKSRIVFDCNYSFYLAKLGSMCRLEKVLAPLTASGKLMFFLRPVQEEGESAITYGLLSLDLIVLRNIADYFLKEVRSKVK